MKFDYDANEMLASTVRRTTYEARAPKKAKRGFWGYVFFWL